MNFSFIALSGLFFITNLSAMEDSRIIDEEEREFIGRAYISILEKTSDIPKLALISLISNINKYQMAVNKFTYTKDEKEITMPGEDFRYVRAAVMSLLHDHQVQRSTLMCALAQPKDIESFKFSLGKFPSLVNEIIPEHSSPINVKLSSHRSKIKANLRKPVSLDVRYLNNDDPSEEIIPKIQNIKESIKTFICEEKIILNIDPEHFKPNNRPVNKLIKKSKARKTNSLNALYSQKESNQKQNSLPGSGNRSPQSYSSSSHSPSSSPKLTPIDESEDSSEKK